ncbi:hypothetical protein LIER_43023 [Lithospermum erythrorhizon]|uniref:Uncharacterized protein n=1 Tax=Lithospermum erythrorhizon TaxID=34254 RepID=A0AAV3PB77_LITER
MENCEEGVEFLQLLVGEEEASPELLELEVAGVEQIGGAGGSLQICTNDFVGLLLVRRRRKKDVRSNTREQRASATAYLVNKWRCPIIGHGFDTSGGASFEL